MSRSDFFTLERKKTVIYSDFLTSFERNPTTDNLAINTNENAVKRSVRNIVMTACGERFYDSKKGTKARGQLFDLYDPTVVEVLKLQIGESLMRYEPRASPIQVDIVPNIDDHSVRVRIAFGIINIQDELFQMEVVVKKIR